jgi:RsiW-degrading membrane proteinase PrsW (M82 family)
MNLVWMILSAILPGLVFTLFILFIDRYDKEPKLLLVKVFLFGMLATIPTIIAETIGQYLNIFSGLFGLLFEAFIVIGLSEEFFKRFVVLRLAFKHPAFNEKLDGIVYCGIAALGFATFENIFYIINYSAVVPDIWITRAVLSVPAHMLLGITMGYYLSLARFCNEPEKCRSYMRKSLYIPAILHGALDFILMTDTPLISLLLVPFIIILWLTSMVRLGGYYKDSKELHRR